MRIVWLKSCKQAGCAHPLATVVTVIGTGATVNTGTPLLANRVYPEQG